MHTCANNVNTLVPHVYMGCLFLPFFSGDGLDGEITVKVSAMEEHGTACVQYTHVSDCM